MLLFIMGVKIMRKLNKQDIEDKRYGLLDIALRLAKKIGYRQVTFEHVSGVANISRTTMYIYFKSVTDFQKRLVEYAIDIENIPVVTQALADNNPIAKKINGNLRNKVISQI
jgi:AcrR family transcriptional regulator